MAKCDSPVLTEGGLTVGCTLDAPHDGVDHRYDKEIDEFRGSVLFCPVCATNVEASSDPDDNNLLRECPNCDTVFTIGNLPYPEDADKYEGSLPFSGAILLSPCHQAAVDATHWGVASYTCPDDNLRFTVNVDPDVVAEHSMVG